MDNRVTKERVANHLEYDWFKYLLILVASIALFVFVFIMINKTRDVEDIRVFASAYAKKEYAFSGKAMQALQSGGDNRIREVELNYYDVKDSSYIMQLQSNGVMSSDILIVGETVLKQFGSGLLTLNDEILARMLPDGFIPELYRDESGAARAVRVDTLKNVSEALVFSYEGEKPDDAEEDDFTYDTKFYLAVNAKSKNIGEYGTKGVAGNYQTFTVASTFFTCFL